MTRALMVCLAFGYGLILGFVLTALWARLARRRKVLHRRALRRWHRLKAPSELRRVISTAPLLVARSALLNFGRERRN